MKILKLQEQFFGKDKEFRTTKILKKHPELLDGKPVEFEVVSPDYERTSELKGVGVFDDFVYDKCKKCPNLNYIEDDELECSSTKETIRTSYWGARPNHTYFDGIKKCPIHNKGKKLGTMKLELATIQRFGWIENWGTKKQWNTMYFEEWTSADADRVRISQDEADFIKDNEYFKENDLVVVLKVSEVVRYE